MATFDFAFDPTWALPLRLTTGATPANSSVVIDDERLEARFGWLHVVTAVSNIRDVTTTRDYRWYRALGARMSLADRGATYGSNAEGGVCVCFHEPVRALPVASSPGLTLTVADLDGFAEAVRDAAGLTT